LSGYGRLILTKIGGEMKTVVILASELLGEQNNRLASE
jgi:hypothetical protein